MKKAAIFRKPPVVERVMGIKALVGDEHFERQTESWTSIIQSAFPIAQPITLIQINIEERQGELRMPAVKPRFQIHQRYWERLPELRPNWCLQSRKDGFFMNFCNQPESPGEFSGLLQRFLEWYPQWSNHFHAMSSTGVVLHYVNMVAKDTMPGFVDGTGRVNVQNAIKIFSHFGDSFPNIIPPYHCEANFNVQGPQPTRLTLRVAGLQEQRAGAAAVKVELIAKIRYEPEGINLQRLNDNYTFLHSVILEQFHNVFTESALKSFS